jgi:hypothetical protein
VREHACCPSCDDKRISSSTAESTSSGRPQPFWTARYNQRMLHDVLTSITNALAISQTQHDRTIQYGMVYARIISKTTIHYPASDFFDRNPLARGSTSTTHLKSTWLSHGWPRSATVPSPLWLLLTLSFSRSLPTTSQAGSRSFAPSLPRDKV